MVLAMDSDIQHYELSLVVFLNHIEKEIIMYFATISQTTNTEKARSVFFFFSYSIIFVLHFFSPSEIFAQISK